MHFYNFISKHYEKFQKISFNSTHTKQKRLHYEIGLIHNEILEWKYCITLQSRVLQLTFQLSTEYFQPSTTAYCRLVEFRMKLPLKMNGGIQYQ